MSLRITRLIENSVGEDSSLEHEHGISFFNEKHGHSGAFAKNSAQLGRDLSALKLVVLSHGHYDHTGGFLRILDTARNFELCLKECIFHKKYIHEKGTYTFKGKPFEGGRSASSDGDFCPVAGSYSSLLS